MMNPDVKTKWVAALRSGKYEQAMGCLKDNNSYCCLGVLCEISDVETGFGIDENFKENGSIHNLSDTVIRWAGLKVVYGDRVNIHGKFNVLSAHNDEGATFLQIADAIESQL